MSKNNDLLAQLKDLYTEDHIERKEGNKERVYSYMSDALISYLPLGVFVIISRQGFVDVFYRIVGGHEVDEILIHTTLSNLWLNISYIYFSQFRRTSFDNSAQSFFLSCLKLTLGVVAIVMYTTQTYTPYFPVISILVSFVTLYFTVHAQFNIEK